MSSELLPLLVVPSSGKYSISALLLSCSFFQRPPSAARARCAMFNFGDSNTDTGEHLAGVGFQLHKPYGRLFFGKPSGRLCDGRIYTDFICERLGIDYLSPYLESSGASFGHGANFAVAGATTGSMRPSTFSLLTQVRQFRHFKKRTAELLPLGLGSLITEGGFQRAVYSFDIGQNDIYLALTGANLTFRHSMQSILDAITTVYETGGRKFLIYNTGPLGCLPATLVRWGRQYSKFDSVGCLAAHNNLSKAFNEKLNRLCDDLTSKFSDATIVCVDMYAIKYELFVNHTAYGFSKPLMACCGGGRPPYNYNETMHCGSRKAMGCPDVSRHILWDGAHHTEAANKIVADKILSSQYNHPQLPLQTICNS